MATSLPVHEPLGVEQEAEALQEQLQVPPKTPALHEQPHPPGSALHEVVTSQVPCTPSAPSQVPARTPVRNSPVASQLVAVAALQLWETEHGAGLQLQLQELNQPWLQLQEQDRLQLPLGGLQAPPL